MQEQLKTRDPEFGLKIAIISFLFALCGGALVFVSDQLGWVVVALSMLGGFIGIGIHWWHNWRRIFLGHD